MSDDLRPLGSFYAVCISNPPMVMAGTVGRNELETQIRYMSSVLGVEAKVLYNIRNYRQTLFDLMWAEILSSDNIQIRSFEAPTPDSLRVP